MRVTKLASLLRIADALDRPHDQRVRDLRVIIRNDEAELHAISALDIDIIASILRKKGQVFEETTGLKLILQKVER